MDSSARMRAATISRFKKERFLLSMAEDDFRDKVVRPLLLRQGLKDGRDLCGPREKGKDALFIAIDKLGMSDLYAVQTKRGHLNLSKKPNTNLIETITQLKTALQTDVYLPFAKEKKLPAKAIVCTSGKINDSAQQHIKDQVQDPRIVFMDSDELIPKIDEVYPELWFDIDAQVLPYLRFIKRTIEELGEDLAVSDILPGGISVGAATDKMFVPLQLYRIVEKVKRHKGQTILVPKFEEMPLVAILNRHERLFLILGEAGSGKSTSLRRLAYILAQKGLETDKPIVIPVLLRATDVVAKQNLSLLDICAEETKKLMNSDSPSFTQQNLAGGEVIVFIDALDELVDDAGRTSVLTLIKQFHTLYPECRVILTSREYAFLKDLPDLKTFATFRLSPINYKQAEQIIDRLRKGQSLPIENSKEIIRRLQDVHGMELNPLLVTVFAATTEYSRQDIPANITELFKKFTEMMLGRWDASKGLAHQYHAPLKDFLLKKVGFEMHRRQVTSISTGEFQNIIASELTSRGHKADTGQILDEIVNRSGLFRTMGDSIEFRHLLLQEFFAGRGIPSKDFLQTVVGEEWWSRAIVFYFGENASDIAGLESSIKSLKARPVQEVFSAAVTIGLALQACYLAEVREKLLILKWVIEALSSTKDAFLADANRGKRFPLTSFLIYYLFGRDSVACKIIQDASKEILDSVANNALTNEQKDVREFWVIIGLIETGALEQAEALVRRFHPSDSRLLLGIYLGCQLIRHLQMHSKGQRQYAESICSTLSERVSHLRKELLAEVKTELLEVRKGEIKSIEAPPEQNL